MATKTIADIDVSGKRVLMRVDFNVPLDDGKVTNDKRIVAALPSIKYVLDGGGALILMSHLGRPKGEGFEEKLSLKPVADRLSELLDRPVTLGPPEVVGPDAEKLASDLKAGNVVLLENLRFHPGETMPEKAQKSPNGQLTPDQRNTLFEFVQALGRLGEVYVNDAFGTCHRKHASMYGAARIIHAAGGPAVAGFLVEKEIKYLHDAVSDPARPFVAILGGAKVSDKIKLISSLLDKVDRIIIGGAMAYTLLKSQGVPVGKSLVEEDQVEPMKALLERAGDKIVLPDDNVVTDDFDTGKPQTTDGLGMADDMQGMDIGPETIKKFGGIIATAKTVVWNGPMGVFEKPDYAAGTKAIAEVVAEATDAGAVSVIGGGDSAAAVDQMGLAGRMTHVSTGGGASLAYLEGKPMPALEVLDQK
ncbi:MAG: phosphoglycerate kinase [Planctomycetota bacterium]|nr:phosphoglycerate kinase [Planctomycetota bacterium]